jgi:uncharacterized membrane protein YoaK (UPF0700 family)
MEIWSKDQVLKIQYLPLWSTLSFQAGFINSFGFLACGRYVSHVTGFGTQAGIALGAGKWALAVEMFGTPFFFILGAMISGIYTAARQARKRVPRYDLVSVLFPMLTIILIYFGAKGRFGPFGEDLLYFHDFVLLFSLSFACGIQNACFTTLTGGVVRTTHLTGLSTDLGIELSKAFFGDLSESERSWIWKSNMNRIFSFLSFTAGSILSVRISENLKYLSLCVPLLSSMGVFLVTLHLQRQATRQMQEKSLRSPSWIPG